MIAETTLRSSLERLRLIKFFPGSSPEALKEIADMLCEVHDRDEQLERAVTTILRDRDWAEWRGAGAFYAALQHKKHTQCDHIAIRRSIELMDQQEICQSKLIENKFPIPPRSRKTSKEDDVVCARCSNCGVVVAARFVGGPLLALAGLAPSEAYGRCPECSGGQLSAKKAS